MRYLLACLLLFVGCSQTISDPVQTNLTLLWTAPGDDLYGGTATAYEFRWTDDQSLFWDNATVIPNPPAPLTAGTPQSLTFTFNMEPEIVYYFAVKAVDNQGLWSAMSNVASAVLVDTIPPGTITDLQVQF